MTIAIILLKWERFKMPLTIFKIKIGCFDGFPEKQMQMIVETASEQVKEAAWIHIQNETNGFSRETFETLYIPHEEESLVYCEFNLEFEYEGFSIFFN